MSEIQFQPPVDNSLDVRSFPHMPLLVSRLLSSDLAVLSTGEEFKAAILLWCTAWHQVPAGSLTDHPKWLAKHSGAGTVEEWDKVKDAALRGFRKCSDGRLYHSVICELAVNAFATKRVNRKRTEAAIAARNMGRNAQRHIEPDSERHEPTHIERDDQRHMQRDGQENGNVTLTNRTEQNRTELKSKGALSAPPPPPPVDKLVFPPGLSPRQCEDAAKLLRENPRPQELLDELDGILAGGKIRSPIAMLRKLIADQKSNDLALQHAPLKALQREERQIHAEVAKANAAKVPREPPRTASRPAPPPDDPPSDDDDNSADPPRAIDDPDGMLDADDNGLPSDWHLTDEGILAIGIEKGVETIAGQEFEEFTARVFAAAGDGPWLDEASDEMRKRVTFHKRRGFNADVPEKPRVRQPVRASG